MQQLKTIISTAVPLPIEDIDTDQIIPARYLKATDRLGFGDNLFRDWRYDNNNNPIESFVLNNTIYKGEILVAGKNFGCGSSREHAAWALYDYGFKAVLSSFYADIFKGNALNNGLLPVQLKDEEINIIFSAIENNPDVEIEINIENQTVKVSGVEEYFSFEIDPYKKHCLINGFSDLDFLLSIRDKVEKFEQQHVLF